MRKRLGWWLRCLADRIDHEHSPRAMSYYFHFEQGKGIVFTLGGPGCRMWYMADDYDKAHPYG